MDRFKAVGLSVSLLCLQAAAYAASNSVTVGSVRVEAISPTLVRLEEKGPKGFEDRPTFHVVNRDGDGPGLTVDTSGDQAIIHGPDFSVTLAKDATSLKGAIVRSKDDQKLWSYDQLPPNNVWLPDPDSHAVAWGFADTPRLARSDAADAPKTGNVGWDSSNDAADVYVFLPHGDYRQLRSDFLKLTGPTEMMPLYAFGAWDSRWYEYNEKTALQQIDEYRSRKIPLDVLVIDTDWRVGGSHGYDINTKDFPDLKAFFDAAHQKNVRVMFNDHPEPVAESALDPKELKYRTDNLTRLLNLGLDIWWYDRNWGTHLHTPMQGIRLEAWGIELYHDITAAVRPERRPLIMANVVGIDNGIRNAAPDVATHRAPSQWTGDIKPTYDTLAGSIANAIHAGVANCFAYESDDLGGHVSDPSPEGFVRWIEFGALSPIYRPHCTKNLTRMPWTFGAEAETIARNYVQMRYRLLPTFYAASHENYVSGEPLLRRLDLEFPGTKDAMREDQYLIGRGLLVAPVMRGSGASAVPANLYKTADGKDGVMAEYFDNDQVQGQPIVTRIDKNIDFNWHRGSPAPHVPNDHFSARWTGKLGPLPGKSGEQFTISATADDGVRMWLDGKLVIDRWLPQDSVTTDASIPLDAGKTYDLRVEYNDLVRDAVCRLELAQIGNSSGEQTREVWIPPGDWTNLWTGEKLTGPKTADVKASLGQLPMFARAGSMMLLGPDVQFTAEKPWDQVAIDLYPDATSPTAATLYEDDGNSVAYQKGAFRTTEISTDKLNDSGEMPLHIAAAKGTFDQALQERGYTVRVHGLAGRRFDHATLSGQPLQARALTRDGDAMPLSHGAVPDGDVVELTVPSATVDQPREILLNFAKQ